MLLKGRATDFLYAFEANVLRHFAKIFSLAVHGLMLRVYLAACNNNLPSTKKVMLYHRNGISGNLKDFFAWRALPHDQ
ncbi:hypothetical protein CQW29_09965 [Pantoea coffeiphila]|uniref:Uncharacterized protein n=1 Tax=Pantoea coffeiphila TaxID=1465635 RepID=A0A2S9IDQ0_9GAMM|nr:hypothetical protein CQW29_09965 [Pantoea coffeiphila]